MLTNGTLFILGAGASAPYGFPVGNDLRDALYSLPTNGIGDVLRKNFTYSHDQLISFSTEFQGSGQSSIDAFLSKRKDMDQLGRLSIAACLCQCESPDLLFRPDAKHKNNDNWYMSLWNAMQKGINESDELASDKVRFITFNYDRSLEYFLHSAIKNSFGINQDKAYALLRKIRIYHVYGMLDEFDYCDSERGATYKPDASTNRLKRAADMIKTIPVMRTDKEGLEIIHDCVDWARHICILGFGFDQQNMDVLDIPGRFIKKHQSAKSIYVCASMLNRHQSYGEQVRARYFKDVSFDPVFSSNSTALEHFLSIRGC
jgi:hypothetical protein